jgi:hypothetical protein
MLPFPFCLDRLKLGNFPLLLSIVWLSAGCQQKDTIQLNRAKPEIEIPFKDGRSQNGKVMHLFKDTAYLLTSGLSFRSGQQLIIDPGTIIKCTGLSNGIEILPGAIIQANGTQNEPIIFTSGSTAGTRKSGDWRGIYIEGNAPNNAVNNANANIEDFSGTLNYVRIEFAPLELKSVGNRSLIDFVQVSYANGQAAIKINGGSFSAKHLIAYASNSQSDFYITNGYQGGLQNLLAHRHPYFSNGNEPQKTLLTGFYIENNEASNLKLNPTTYAVVSNLSVIGPGSNAEAMSVYADTTFKNAALLTTGNAGFNMRNSLFTGYNAATWYLDDYDVSQSIVDLRTQFVSNVICDNPLQRAFYLYPGSYKFYDRVDFKRFMLEERFRNRYVEQLNQLQLKDPFNYQTPDPSPMDSSMLFKQADFSGSTFSNSFFTKYNYVGAIGKENWFAGWVNFNPIKEDYNSYK